MRVAFWVYLLLLCVLEAARAESVNVAVSSNFASALEVISRSFEEATGHRVISTSGATGKFYAQIKSGAPFEVFLSADAATPQRLEEEGWVVTGSRFTYAIGRLVLWSSKSHVIDREGKVLAKGDFEHLSMANPKTSPYGLAAMEVMENRGLVGRLSPKLVQGENIAQAHQFIVSGNAQLGFVALSQVYRDGQLTSGSAWFIPDGEYKPIRQDVALLKNGAGNPVAKAFLAYIKSPAALDVMSSFGYRTE